MNKKSLSGTVAAAVSACLFAGSVSAALLPQSTVPLNVASYPSGSTIFAYAENPFPQSVTINSVTIAHADHAGSLQISAGTLQSSNGKNWTFPYSSGATTVQFPSPITIDASQVSDGTIQLYSSPISFSGAQYYSDSVYPYYCSGGCLVNPNATVTWNRNLSTEIVSAQNSQCLNVYGGFTTAGTGIIQWTCEASSNEIWTLTPVGDYYHLVAENSGQCLNVPGNSNQADVQLIQWSCQDASAFNDQWSVVLLSSGNYQIVSRSSGLCVNMKDGGTVVQGTCQVSSSNLNQFNLPQLPPAWGRSYSL